jgi:hypothetical protein
MPSNFFRDIQPSSQKVLCSGACFIFVRKYSPPRNVEY